MWVYEKGYYGDYYTPDEPECEIPCCDICNDSNDDIRQIGDKMFCYDCFRRQVAEKLKESWQSLTLVEGSVEFRLFDGEEITFDDYVDIKMEDEYDDEWKGYDRLEVNYSVEHDFDEDYYRFRDDD